MSNIEEKPTTKVILNPVERNVEIYIKKLGNIGWKIQFDGDKTVFNRETKHVSSKDELYRFIDAKLEELDKGESEYLKRIFNEHKDQIEKIVKNGITVDDLRASYWR